MHYLNQEARSKISVKTILDCLSLDSEMNKNVSFLSRPIFKTLFCH